MIKAKKQTKILNWLLENNLKKRNTLNSRQNRDLFSKRLQDKTR